MKRTNIYKASNVTFDPTRVLAYSYAWFSFVRVIDGIVIFNAYPYSTSTCKHQHKVRRLMADLGIRIDVTLQTPKSLDVFESLEALYLNAEEHACDAYLIEESKRIRRNERATERRAAARALQASIFKSQVESITHADVVELRANREVSNDTN